jgi:UDP-2,4-diacetamido-2,4,6-trideoxy-beta-L-altropyranose hydrolase
VRFVASSLPAAGVLTGAGFIASAEPEPGDVRETLDTVTRASRPRLCVVDDPALHARTLRELTGVAPVACLDDTAERVLPVDVVVNGSAGAERLAYSAAANTRYALGPAYMILRKEFRAMPLRSPSAAGVCRVLILTGGGDVGSIGGRLVDIVAHTLRAARIDVVVGPFGTPPARAGERVHIHVSPPNIAGLMAAADLAVTGGGQTAYELAAAGTPALGVRLAGNQRVNLCELERAGCLRDLGVPGGPGFDARFAHALATLNEDGAARGQMSECGQRLVDGHGAARVAELLVAAAREAALRCGTR